MYVDGGPSSTGEVGYLRMEGKEVFKEAVKIIQSNSLEAIAKANLQPKDIDMFIPHQANLRIIEAARERLELPLDKCYVNIDKYGNTSAASVLLALHEAINENNKAITAWKNCIKNTQNNDLINEAKIHLNNLQEY